jgi:hypothetical protein
MFVIEQQTQYQWEPVENGEFASLAEAEAAQSELEQKLGWTGMRIVEVPDTPFPSGMTGESAYYACEGPRDQAIAELQQIRSAALRHDSEECRALAEEARVYLAWLADHDSCADMPEDWEPA